MQTSTTQLFTNDEIQGNVLAGFNKDNVVFLFVTFNTNNGTFLTPDCRAWFTKLASETSTNSDVASFNRSFSQRQNELGGDDPPLTEMSKLWIGVALTGGGIKMLKPSLSADLDDERFIDLRDGAARNAADLGDSDPATWKVGGSTNFTNVHVMITVAADDPDELQSEVAELIDDLNRTGAVATAMQGKTLPGDRVGHEHFGFKDGVSQPAVRGFDAEDRGNPGFAEGRSGVKLVDPGQFLFNHGSVAAAPAWMTDGSFVVFRRLEQDVAGFWDNVHQQAALLELSDDLLAAKLVGRWRNGAPLAGNPNGDPGSIRDSENDNNIIFGPADSGSVCPLAAHVRKMNPRQDFVGDENRIIRRGVPFGDPYEPGSTDLRGLNFVCYASSFTPFKTRQFTWANTDNPVGGGMDPVIKTVSAAAPYLIPGTAGSATVTLPTFVTNVGAIYAFAPTIPTLKMLCAGD